MAQLKVRLGFKLMVIFGILALQTLHAQVSEGGFPISFSYDLKQNIPTVMTGFVNRDSLLAADVIESQAGVPTRFGQGFDVSYSLANSGAWEDLPNGDRIWRLLIFSPQAYSINLIYSEYWLPPGAKFYIYSEDTTTVLGAFTEKNNKVHGEFVTGLVKGPVSILEYYEPRAVRGTGAIGGFTRHSAGI